MAKQKTLYFLQTYGQLGNQLAALAHLLAFAIEYNYVVVYPKSDYLTQYLEITKENNRHLQFRRLLVNEKTTSRFSKIIKLLFFNRNRKILNYLFLNNRFIVDEQFNRQQQPDVILVTDWLFRYYEGIVKYQQPLRTQLRFTKDAIEKGQQEWKLLQSRFPEHTFIGFHIRRGDYNVWMGGIYFYDNDTYYKWMKQISEQVEKPVFIICSNEEVKLDNESDLNIEYAKGSPSEDLYLLAQCRYILGPPSTFSSWSAFWGDQCLRFVRSKDENVQMEDFVKFYIK